MRLVRRRALLLVLPLLVGGVGVGLAGRLHSGEVREPLPEPPPGLGSTREAPGVSSVSPPPRPTPAVDFAQEERLRMLERRLAELSARSEPSAPLTPPRPSREEAREQLFQRHQQQLDRHAREAIDASWAREAQGAFASDFAALTQGQSFQVRRIDCRSTTCVTTLEWPSYAEATQGYALLLQHSYGMDCARSILLPEPADLSARYQADLFLDCGNLR